MRFLSSVLCLFALLPVFLLSGSVQASSKQDEIMEHANEFAIGDLDDIIEQRV